MSLPNREQLNLSAHNLLCRAARRAGLDVVRADFYSPIVDSTTLASEALERPASMPGLELNLDGQLALVRERMMPHIAQLQLPLHAPPGAFVPFLDNPWYGPMDAHILYGIVRWGAPRRVLELGSGFSTLFIERALADNAGEQAPARHVVIDPYPSPLLDHLRRTLEVRTISAADLPSAAFAELEAGDVLFVDTSHTVRPGGEVIRIVLEALPSLAAGVVVHFHDIFRPFQYPRIFYERYNVHWQEQYLLQAFLAFNPHFSVLCANHALWRQRREAALALFPGLRQGMQPSGFWFRRLPEPAP